MHDNWFLFFGFPRACVKTWLEINMYVHFKWAPNLWFHRLLLPKKTMIICTTEAIILSEYALNKALKSLYRSPGTKWQWWYLRDMVTTWKTHQNTPRNNSLLNSAKMQLTQYGGHFEKKIAAQNFFSIVPSCSPHQFTPRYQFSLKSDKVYIFAIWWRPFWKKWRLGNKIS